MTCWRPSCLFPLHATNEVFKSKMDEMHPVVTLYENTLIMLVEVGASLQTTVSSPSCQVASLFLNV